MTLTLWDVGGYEVAREQLAKINTGTIYLSRPNLHIACPLVCRVFKVRLPEWPAGDAGDGIASHIIALVLLIRIPKQLHRERIYLEPVLGALLINQILPVFGRYVTANFSDWL